MNQPSERIVVFVTSAQKRAIAARAESLGISVSELMRRAVLSFGATSEQVKAASIVDRLRAPRQPDALNEALQRVARGTRRARAAPKTGSGTAAPAAPQAAAHDDPQTADKPLLPADVLAALTTVTDDATAAVPDAVTRVTAAKAAVLANPIADPTKTAPAPAPVPPRRTRLDTVRDDDDPHGDPATEGGRFA